VLRVEFDFSVLVFCGVFLVLFGLGCWFFFCVVLFSMDRDLTCVKC